MQSDRKIKEFKIAVKFAIGKALNAEDRFFLVDNPSHGYLTTKTEYINDRIIAIFKPATYLIDKNKTTLTLKDKIKIVIGTIEILDEIWENQFLTNFTLEEFVAFRDIRHNAIINVKSLYIKLKQQGVI